MASPLRPSADSLDITRAPLSIRTLSGRVATRPRQGSPLRQPQVDPLERVRGEFIEMRGFSPTPAQAARLFDLSPEECDRVLTRLVAEGFLRRSADGRYRTSAA